jgi:hypothetical protein
MRYEGLTTIVLAVAACFSTFTVSAQTPTKPITITSAEQAHVKPLLIDLAKVRDTWTTKRDTLPETKAVADARTALQKALDAQDSAARKLPEFDSLKTAEARVLDEIYRLMAEHKLSSREYEPVITDKGELAFVRKQQ